MIHKIEKNDMLISLMCLEFKTIKIDQLTKLLPWFAKNEKCQFSNHDVYGHLYDGEKVDLKRKGYYPKYRQIQYLMAHLRQIELLDCDDVEARGYGVRLYCTLNENHKYWISSEENREIFIKLHQFRNLVTKGRALQSDDKQQGFKRLVNLYFNDGI